MQPGVGAALCRVGWAGVTIFFVLSGFLLTHIYLDRFQAGFTRGGLALYAVKRLARIYPLYYFLLALAVVHASWSTHGSSGSLGGLCSHGSLCSHGRLELDRFDFGNVLSHLTMVHGFYGPYVTSYIPASWSLSIEESFYLVLPVLIWLLLRLSSRVDLMTAGLALTLSCVLFWGLGRVIASQ